MEEYQLAKYVWRTYQGAGVDLLLLRKGLFVAEVRPEGEGWMVTNMEAGAEGGVNGKSDWRKRGAKNKEEAQAMALAAAMAFFGDGPQEVGIGA